jgi:aminoglycoside 3-N-acetyltransferase
MVPTYTYSYIGKEGAAAFDINTTTSVGNGIIADTLWRRADAKRSNHPSYSFGAIGKNARYLTKDHPLNAPLGIDSPLHRLALSGGRILLLGVMQDRNSLIHVVEAAAGVKYQCLPFKESWGKAAKIINNKGREEYVDQNEFPGCSFNFGVVEDTLINKGLIEFGKVGNATTRLMAANGIIITVIQILKKDPGFLLCKRPECECCTKRKKLLDTNITRH